MAISILHRPEIPQCTHQWQQRGRGSRSHCSHRSNSEWDQERVGNWWWHPVTVLCCHTRRNPFKSTFNAQMYELFAKLHLSDCCWRHIGAQHRLCRKTIPPLECTWRTLRSWLFYTTYSCKNSFAPWITSRTKRAYLGMKLGTCQNIFTSMQERAIATPKSSAQDFCDAITIPTRSSRSVLPVCSVLVWMGFHTQDGIGLDDRFDYLVAKDKPLHISCNPQQRQQHCHVLHPSVLTVWHRMYAPAPG